MSKHYWRRWVSSGLVTLALMLAIAVPGWGQAPPTRNVQLPIPTTAAASSPVSEIVTADVQLDGRRLFAIAAPAVRPQPAQATNTPLIHDRVETIEAILNSLVNRPFDPKTLEVTSSVDPESRQPVISVGERYLMTVTSLDAQLQGQTPERRAEELTGIIKNALVTGRQERQPDSLIQRLILAGEILLAMLVASWVIAQIQKRLRAQGHALRTQISAEPDPSSTLSPTGTQAVTAVQQQLNRRQQRNVNEVRRRLLQLIQASIWGSGSFIILGQFPYTRWLQPLLFSGPLKVLAIGLATYVAIRASDVLIDRFFSALTEQELITPHTSQRLAQRVSTFSRVLRSVVGVAWVGTGLLSILSVLGVELGPVLAGAGILGLAVSFASQNLIKDVINGLLILYEDQYAVGDVIQVGKASGLVESMNLRITQLRNAEGRLITIPNSSITIVENLSKDWSRVDLALTIAYDANADQAIEVIRQVGTDMRNDPSWQDKIPEPPEVLGIDDIGNAGLTIRIWIKTLPLQQWNVAREFRRRLKLALDDQGIAIGVPQQPLWYRSPSELATSKGEEEDSQKLASPPH